MTFAAPAPAALPYTRRAITALETEAFQGNAAPLNAGARAITTLASEVLRQAEVATFYLENTTDQAVTFRFYTSPTDDVARPFQVPGSDALGGSFVLAAGNVTPQRDWVSLSAEAHRNLWCEATPAGATTVGAATIQLSTSVFVRKDPA